MFLTTNGLEPYPVGPLESLCFSVATITTLGYGDIHPSLGVGRLLVIGELSFGHFFLAIFLATVVSWANGQPKPPEVWEISEIKQAGVSSGSEDATT